MLSWMDSIHGCCLLGVMWLHSNHKVLGPLTPVQYQSPQSTVSTTDQVTAHSRGHTSAHGQGQLTGMSKCLLKPQASSITAVCCWQVARLFKSLLLLFSGFYCPVHAPYLPLMHIAISRQCCYFWTHTPLYVY